MDFGKVPILFLYGFPALKKDLSAVIRRLGDDSFITDSVDQALELETFSVAAYSAGIIQFLDIWKDNPSIRGKVKRIVLVAPVGIRPTNMVWHSLRFFGEVLKTDYKKEVIKELLWDLVRGKRSFRRIRRIAGFDLSTELEDLSTVDIKIVGNGNDVFLKMALGIGHDFTMETVGSGHFAPLEFPDIYAAAIKAV